MTIETDTITLPSHWACALINDDYSGMDDAEERRCRKVARSMARDGWSVASVVDDSDHFTCQYDLYDPDANVSGGMVMDYTILRNI